MEIQEIIAKETKELIATNLHLIKLEEGLIESLEIVKKRSEQTIAIRRKEVWNVVSNVSTDAIGWSSSLGKFLSVKPKMPHENYKSNHEVFVKIITEMLTSSLQYGRTTRGGAGQIGFTSSQEGLLVWSEICTDLKKVCTQFFDVTPFLDVEKENFPEIGFFMNSKWLNHGGEIIRVSE